MSKQLIEQLRRLGDPLISTDYEMLEQAARRIEELERELECERIRLAACGVVALANTPESAAKAREMLPKYRSASCNDVARIVDSEIALRQERDALQADNARLRDALEDSYMTNPCDTHSQQAAFDKAQSALFATPEQSLTEYRNKVIEQMIACYSPDDSAHDYFDKLNALKGQS